MARRRSGKKIDFVHWTLITGDASALAAGSVAVNVSAAQHEPETILRLRGEYTTYLDGAQTGSQRVSVAAGLILVPEGTGTTVLWSPMTDGDAPWLWFDISTLAYEEPVVDVVDIPAMTGVRRVIDNKAMRIVRNQELQFVVENATIGVASAVNATIGARLLTGA